MLFLPLQNALELAYKRLNFQFFGVKSRTPTSVLKVIKSWQLHWRDHLKRKHVQVNLVEADILAFIILQYEHTSYDNL